MTIKWDFTGGGTPVADTLWTFLDWSSQTVLDENNTIYGITLPYATDYIYYAVDDSASQKAVSSDIAIWPPYGSYTMDLSYSDRITYTDGTQQLSLLGTNLDAVGTDTYWFDADVVGVTFYDSATGEHWIAVLEDMKLSPTDLVALYTENGSAAMTRLLMQGEDQMSGSDGADVFNSYGGNDFLSSGAGDDVLNGGAGADSLYGGDGNDRLSGSFGSDFLYGGVGADRLYGGKGHDYLDAGSGEDWLYGGAGNDTLSGSYDSGSTVHLNGGDGNDWLYANGSGLAIMNGGDGDDYMVGSWTGYTSERTKMYGGNGNDTLISDFSDDTMFGQDGDDLLLGGKGANVMFGGAGNDTLRGRGGDDRISGGDGNDLIFGGAGDDTLRAGAGGDTLSGGNGADLFIFRETDEVVTITDFVRTTDRIILEGMVDLQGTATLVYSAEAPIEGEPEPEYLATAHIFIGDLELRFVGSGMDISLDDLLFS